MKIPYFLTKKCWELQVEWSPVYSTTDIPLIAVQVFFVLRKKYRLKKGETINLTFWTIEFYAQIHRLDIFIQIPLFGGDIRLRTFGNQKKFDFLRMKFINIFNK